jgi:hypothetical protein
MVRKQLNADDDYYIVVSQDPSTRWTWELRRKSYPLGVRVYDGEFESKEAAELAGEKALKRFLEQLSQQE